MNMTIFILGILIEALGNLCKMRVSALSHFICFYGVMSLLDPVLILLVDIILHNYGCDKVAVCNVDMSAEACHCVYGDAFKLPRLTLQKHGSAFIGVLITLGFYLSLMVLSGILLYLYT